MLCENCNVRTATVHYTKIINGKRQDIQLCEKCAQSKSLMEDKYTFSLNDFLSEFFNIPITIGIKENSSNINNDLYCKKCNLTFEEFKKAGKLGCSECYDSFSERLKPILKKLHGNINHTGKYPNGSDGKIKTRKEIQKLRMQLSDAIKQEEYEKAAQLRDKIKELEQLT